MNPPPRATNENMARRVASTVVGKGRTLYKRVRHDPQQVERFECPQRSAANVLVIGPAEMPIPAAGWGAVETVISEQIPALVDRGFKVTLLNSRRRRLWLEAFEGADIVLCHYDAFAARAIREARARHIPCVVVTHYGYAAFPEKWEPGYYELFQSMLPADRVACLSPGIQEVFSSMGFGPRAKLTPNGSNLAPTLSDHSRGPLILGKIEPRKGQYEVAAAANAAGEPLTLVGPMHDGRVRELLHNAPKSTVRWLGAWSRDELSLRLSDFSSLILPSRGEADALVLYEAQLAGLAVVVSSFGVGAQDVSLPWVHVVDPEVDDAPVRFLEVSRQPTNHGAIESHSRRHYLWQARIDPWVSIIRDLL